MFLSFILCHFFPHNSRKLLILRFLKQIQYLKKHPAFFEVNEKKHRFFLGLSLFVRRPWRDSLRHRVFYFFERLSFIMPSMTRLFKAGLLLGWASLSASSLPSSSSSSSSSSVAFFSFVATVSGLPMQNCPPPSP